MFICSLTKSQGTKTSSCSFHSYSSLLTERRGLVIFLFTLFSVIPLVINHQPLSPEPVCILTDIVCEPDHKVSGRGDGQKTRSRGLTCAKELFSLYRLSNGIEEFPPHTNTSGCLSSLLMHTSI